MLHQLKRKSLISLNAKRCPPIYMLCETTKNCKIYGWKVENFIPIKVKEKLLSEAHTIVLNLQRSSLEIITSKDAAAGNSLVRNNRNIHRMKMQQDRGKVRTIFKM